MNSKPEVLYVRTPSLYGNKHSAKHIIPYKIYKVTRRTSGAYKLISDYVGTEDTNDLCIHTQNSSWLNNNPWELATEDEYNKQENIMKDTNTKDTKKLSRTDCFREYARVIEMCEGTLVDSKTCIRLDGESSSCTSLSFMNTAITYTFAIRIHEGTPVFEGDLLYGTTEDILGREYEAKPYWNNSTWAGLSWGKPVKKTCLLNGTELPLADGNKFDYPLLLTEIKYKNIENRDKVSAAIVKLLKGEQQ